MDASVTKLIAQMKNLEVKPVQTAALQSAFPLMKKCASTNDLVATCSDNDSGLLPLLRRTVVEDIQLLLPNMIRESIQSLG